MRRFLTALFQVLLLLLIELRDRAYMLLLVAIGAGLVARDIRPGVEWGVGMVVFGGLSLVLRTDRAKKEGSGR